MPSLATVLISSALKSIQDMACLEESTAQLCGARSVKNATDEESNATQVKATVACLWAMSVHPEAETRLLHGRLNFRG